MSKFTYFMRTIEGFDQSISPVDDMLNDKFIPTLFGSDSLSAEIREALELKSSDGGLGLYKLEDSAKHQFRSSRLITSPDLAAITSQKDTMLEQNADGCILDDLRMETDQRNQKEGNKKSRMLMRKHHWT